MSGLAGNSTVGVGSDIVAFLKEVADFFGATIYVTSGYRSPDGQAQAMFDNWTKMDHGRVYKRTSLPETDRATLDAYFEEAHDPKATRKHRHEAKEAFLKLARERVGMKSLHTRGRAVDLQQASVNAKVYKAISMRMQEVKEGKPPRKDIYHFQSITAIPPVDEALKSKWRALLDGRGPPHHKTTHHHHHVHYTMC
jgi:hypothetical protein